MAQIPQDASVEAPVDAPADTSVEAGVVRVFRAVMSGGAVAMPVMTSGTGSVDVFLSADEGSITCSGSFTGLANPTVAHVHNAPPGANGVLVFHLVVAGSSLSCAQPITAADVSKLKAGQLFADVHSSDHPAGEIRGQLTER